MRQRLSVFFHVLSLMTILPVPRHRYPENRACAPIFFSVIGLLLSTCLFACFFLFKTLLLDKPLVLAALVLLAWVILTGAMHLDGFADSVDAWYASHKNNGTIENTLKVMKDPTSGAMAIVFILLLLILKFGLLVYSFENFFSTILLSMCTARFFASLTVIFIPYAREQGLAELVGATPGHHFDKTKVVTFFALLVYVLCIGPVLFIEAHIVHQFVCAFIVAGLVFWCWSWLWRKKIAGYTGDTLGAQIELIELVVLFVLVAST